MKKSRFFFPYIFILSLLLQGCAANSTAPSSSASGTNESAASVTSDDTTAEPVTSDDTIAEPVTSDDTPADPTSSDAATAGTVSVSSLSEESGILGRLRTGDIPELDLTPPQGEPLEGSAGDALKTGLGDISKAPSSFSLIKNNSTYFYYLSQLTSDEQQVYEALYSVLSYPDDTSWSATVSIRCDPASDDFNYLWSRVYAALFYDHPELFWYWSRQSCGDLQWSYHPTPDSNGRYSATFRLKNPYSQYQTEMTAFNRETKNFLDKIDLSQSDACIAMQIHDGLMDLCHYNDDLLANPHQDSYGYTAYGALVDDGDGRDHCCVCAGYALAYEYLLQQVGIPCIYVCGYSGPDYSDLDGHAWNLVLLDGDWYEVDVTWNDIDPAERDLFEQNPAGIKMLNDADYMKKATHYFFCVTTDYISNFTDSGSYLYEDYDTGAWVLPFSDSVRIRCSSDEDPVVYMAPIARGTTYHQGKNCDKVIASTAGPSSSRLYDDGLVFPDSDRRYLTNSDLEGLQSDPSHPMSMLLRMACNELYARHGYRFSTKWFADFYNQYSWYNGGTDGDSASVESRFNDYELANKKFLHDFEKANGWCWSPYE